MQVDQAFIGVDVAKDTLVVCVHGTATRLTLANEQAAIKRWLKTLPADAVVAMESTGRYHQELVRRVHQSGRSAYVLNAKDVYFYAKALGARSKTDRVDAQVIARYAAEHHGSLHAWSPGSQAQEQVQTLVQRRARVAVHRSALRELLRGVEGLQQARDDLDAQFDALQAQIDRQIDLQVASEPQLNHGRELLRTITGIGAQGSALLAALMSRIPFANADALVAYSGLDPRANDSGATSGRRRLSKRGSSDLRRQMYLAAFLRLSQQGARPDVSGDQRARLQADGSVCDSGEEVAAGRLGGVEERTAVRSDSLCQANSLRKSIEPQTAAAS